jgi:hypothetical protein
MMFRIAEDYEKLAKRAEQRLKSSPQSSPLPKVPMN